MRDSSNSKDSSALVVEREPDAEEVTSKGPSGPRIRCPLCGWRPPNLPLWICSCRHVWNTFDTGGVCPACLYHWTVTQCLACHQLSPHSDWYEN